MKYLVSIDDTDMPDTKGTGHLTQELCAKIESANWGICSPISRHQLFVHKDVPYTSHNSTMCFELLPTEFCRTTFIEFCAGFLQENAAKGSDPGLCMALFDKELDVETLITFGRKAKSQLLNKSDAYRIARKTGIHLSEHGGTGDGVIGAVAGVGLRLSGNDGRYRGWYHLGRPGDIVSVKSLCEYDFVDYVTTKEGRILNPEENLEISSEKIKTIRRSNNRVILVYPSENLVMGNSVRYRIITKKEAKAY